MDREYASPPTSSRGPNREAFSPTGGLSTDHDGRSPWGSDADPRAKRPHRSGERSPERQRRRENRAERPGNAHTAQEYPPGERDHRQQRGLVDGIFGCRRTYLDRKTVTAEHGFGFGDAFYPPAVDRVLHEPVKRVGLWNRVHRPRSLEADMEEGFSLGNRNRSPSFAAQVAVDAHVAATDRLGRKAWKNQGQVAGERDHWMLAIKVALTGIAGMNVDIRDHAYSASVADRPEFSEVAPVEPHKPAVEAVRIKVVVKHKTHDARTLTVPMSN